MSVMPPLIYCLTIDIPSPLPQYCHNDAILQFLRALVDFDHCEANRPEQSVPLVFRSQRHSHACHHHDVELGGAPVSSTPREDHLI